MAKILLVSDNNEKINYFDEILTKYSHDFQCAADNQTFFDILPANMPKVIILDASANSFDFSQLYRKINEIKENVITLSIVKDDKIPQELLNISDAFLTEPLSDNVLISTININLRRKDTISKLAMSNQNLSKNLYQLDVLYNIGSQFAATLDKEKLINIMLEGLDKALDYSVACVLTFKSNHEPLLIIDSINQISKRIMEFLYFQKATCNLKQFLI